MLHHAPPLNFQAGEKWSGKNAFYTCPCLVYTAWRRCCLGPGQALIYMMVHVDRECDLLLECLIYFLWCATCRWGRLNWGGHYMYVLPFSNWNFLCAMFLFHLLHFSVLPVHVESPTWSCWPSTVLMSGSCTVGMALYIRVCMYDNPVVQNMLNNIGLLHVSRFVLLTD